MKKRKLLTATIVGTWLTLAGTNIMAQSSPQPAQGQGTQNKTGKDVVAGQHAQIGVKSSAEGGFTRNTHLDAQWFGNAGLGLFIHWGLSSVDGRIDLSWGMMADTPWDKGAFKLTPEAYWKLVERFQPNQYDADKWVSAAKRAGFRYAVLTTRHHDGFALWPSAFGDFNTKNYLGGRDLVAPFVEACRRHGLKVGLYYSPPDWYYNRQHMSFRYRGEQEPPAFGVRHEPITLPVETAEQRATRDRNYKAYIRNQVEELLTRYGRIAVLWFDGGPEAISFERIRELQPGIVVNPRMHGRGDFQTAEVNFPANRPQGWWEMCSIWQQGGWGYMNPEKYKSLGWMLSELVRVRAWGGNYLSNVGPRPTGELPDIVHQRLDELANWMKHSGVSVSDTLPVPEGISANVPLTSRNKTLYAHALPDFKSMIQVQGIEKPKSIKLLRTRADLTLNYEKATLTLEIPTALRSELVDVVEIQLP